LLYSLPLHKGKPLISWLGEDGVHLSGLGNDVFLNTLQGGIEKIVNNLGVNLTFPDVQSG
jgi:lysophospholipase L1-like esterase